MKSIALIIWLLSANGHDRIVERSHYDDMAACEAKAQAVAAHYAQQGGKTRYLCHPVVEEVGDVDENGNPVEVH
ncbi:MAG: hypothetical protein PHR30_14815 [Gallionellaceae bacterium]|nr:hypothetical protein [Gallionellaceae bacterium]MDD5366607.1 hypothetical protein [Gallionellaceae bacterium]